jgi:hypothetical protein
MRKWEIKKAKRSDPYRYLLVLLEDNGDHQRCGHERYPTKEHAIARAKFLANIGQRCDVLVDVAASFGTGE